MNFQSYLKVSAQEIEKELEDFFQIWRQDAKKVNELLVPLVDITIEACQGGKRLRGTLVKLGYELATNEFNKEILKPAAAFEIFQTAILAHDDIIDKSDLRRGKPTIYKALGGDHHAISQTICLGDTGFFQAMQIISQSNFPEKNKNLALQDFSKTMLETALGEILDVEIPFAGVEKNEEDAMTIFHLKTARYTITGPLLLGAILGGGDETLLGNLKQFGDNLGIAFQIQDDILGVFGTELEIGKSVTSDIEEGKLTTLITYALENADQSDRDYLQNFYGQKDVDVEKIKNIFEKTGALDYSKAVALKYVSSAKKFISEVTQDEDKQTILEGMADFLKGRKN